MREALLPLAESVADGTAVDWDEAARQAPPEDQAFVRQLGVLAKLTEVHRTLSESTGDPIVPLMARRSQAAPAIGTWAHLTLLERLGGGTYGEVYRAWDRQLEREVALKLLRGVHGVGDDPETSRITREGRLLARVRHPNVITVHGVDVHEGRVGLWMELLRGQTLEQQLNTRGAFGAREAALIGIDLCRALAALHAAGLLHRDVKADNVIREDGGRIVLMDLGTGREIDGGARRGLPDFAGTPLYIAPEVFDGTLASEATDVFSLGVLLYHLVTGSFPVWAKTVEELKAKHRNAPPIRLRDARADLPTVFVAIVDRAISRNPGDRYLTAGALEADLLKSIDDDTLRLTVAPTRDTVAAESLSSRRSVKAIAALAALAAAIVAGALLALPALRGRETPAAVATVPIRSIAILPLANLSGDPSQEYFADGMTDELIGTLGRLNGVNVISRTSSMQFKGTGKTVPEIARALNVDAVVEGSVLMSPGARQESGTGPERLRINARLIRAGTDTQVWDRTFEAVAGDVIKLQREIAAAVADGINAKLTPPRDAVVAAAQRDPSFDAFDLYLKGRYYWAMRTPESLKQSVQYFQEAINRGYVPAYSGLSDSYHLLGIYGALPADDARRRARDAATQGLELDPSLAEAHASRGYVYHDEFNWAAAEADLKEAVALAPAYATGHHWYAVYLAGQGRFDQAMSELNIALALDPLSVGVNDEIGGLFVLMRRYDDAILHLQQFMATGGAIARTHLQLAEAFALKGDYEAALAELDKTSASGGEQTQLLAEAGYAYGAAGRQREARAVIDQLLVQQRQHADGAVGALATVYSALGDRDRAMLWLDQARQSYDPVITRLKVDPRFDKLRGDPRFAKLLATVGLAQ
jgi:TolB-like protein/tRNA A-37 threonylcarbamoyl transferase component Bud32/Flp pilus assembly protein TadD